MLLTNYFNVTLKNHKENNKTKGDGGVADSASHVPTAPIQSKQQEMDCCSKAILMNHCHLVWGKGN